MPSPLYLPQGAPVPGAEVTLFVVEKAVLDQVPYPLPDLMACMTTPLPGSATASGFRHFDSAALRVAPHAAQVRQLIVVGGS